MAFAEIQLFATGVGQPESESCGRAFTRNVRHGCSPIRLLTYRVEIAVPANDGVPSADVGPKPSARPKPRQCRRWRAGTQSLSRPLP